MILPQQPLEGDVVVGSYVVIPLIDRELVVARTRALAGPDSRPCDAATWNIADWTK
jgi:hypothetical protein